MKASLLLLALAGLMFRGGPAWADLGFATCLLQGQFAGDRIPAYQDEPRTGEAAFAVPRRYADATTNETVVRLCKTSPGGKAYFAVSFNATRRIPDWVAYRLDPRMGQSYSEDGIDYGRDKADFSLDPELRLAHVPQAIPFTYARDAEVPGTADGQGREKAYHRGHLVPSQDMAFDVDANLTTFHYSNCAPQTPALNSGLWRTLEGQVRDWAAGKRPLDGEARERPLWIVTGVYGRAERGERGPAIGPFPQWRAAVPSHFFKVVLFETEAGPTARAWRFPNFAERPANARLEDFEVPLRTLEAESGLRFNADGS